jgi:hypothetical protein
VRTTRRNTILSGVPLASSPGECNASPSSNKAFFPPTKLFFLVSNWPATCPRGDCFGIVCHTINPCQNGKHLSRISWLDGRASLLASKHAPVSIAGGWPGRSANRHRPAYRPASRAAGGSTGGRLALGP